MVRTMMKVLFRMNMTAVNQKAQRWFQKIIWPRSQTSRISGWRRQNSLLYRQMQSSRNCGNARTHQQMSEVYRTKAAMTAVRIRPGTRPKME